MIPAIQIKDLEFKWDETSSLQLSIPSLDVNKGQRVFIHGPSGSGKSSLLNLLSGITLPQKGDINLLDINIGKLSARQRDKFRADHIGIIFQQFNLLPYLSALENIQLRAEFISKRGAAHSKERAMELLSAMGLGDQHATSVDRLSVGQQQRIAVARALFGDPEIIIADEPSSSLDAEARDVFMNLLLRSCAESNATLIFVSHDKQLLPYFDRSVDIREFTGGQITGEGVLS